MAKAKPKQNSESLPLEGEVEPRDRQPRNLKDWHDVIAKVWKDARRGKISEQRACRLVYVASAGAKIAEALEFREQRAQLIEQLKRLDGAGASVVLSQEVRALLEPPGDPSK